MDEFWIKRSCQIPAFGDWESVNEMPITQYFESARQAGLLRYSSSSGECDAVDSRKPRSSVKERGRGKMQQQRKHEAVSVGGRKVFDVTVTEQQKLQFPSKQTAVVSTAEEKRQGKYDAVSALSGADSQAQIARRAPKAVDEDLYKIPPHLLRSSRRRKKLGFISKCLMPPCAAR